MVPPASGVKPNRFCVARYVAPSVFGRFEGLIIDYKPLFTFRYGLRPNRRPARILPAGFPFAQNVLCVAACQVLWSQDCLSCVNLRFSPWLVRMVAPPPF